MHNIEFTTTCYEKDWELLLKTDRLKMMVDACNYPFSKKKVYINNVKNFDKIAAIAEQHKKNGLIDEYIKVSDYEEEVSDFFKITKGKGYYFLIQFLTMIYLSEGDFHLNFTADAMLTNKEPWIDSAIKALQADDRVIVANALSGTKTQRHLVMRESFLDNADFYTSYGFSDHCFLIIPEFFRNDIYNEENPMSEFYPAGSRGSFEERIYRFMRNQDYRRITHKRAEYRHKNFPKDAIKTWLALNTPINNKKYGIRNKK
jgi:hypothetical protein